MQNTNSYHTYVTCTTLGQKTR